MGIPYAEVIGDPIAHSKSPLIHKFWLEKVGLEGDYRATRVSANDLAAYAGQRRRDPLWCGANVTIPHKQSILRHVDETAHPAGAIGAVNAIVLKGSSEPMLIGHNTDATGFLDTLRSWPGMQRTYRTAHVIGTGGGAAAVAWALSSEGFLLIVYSRNPERGAAFRQLFTSPDMDLVQPLDSLGQEMAFDWGNRSDAADILVNATPLGMRGFPPLPISLSGLAPETLVYDLVYDPLETPLLEAARESGLPTLSGIDMLVAQAARAFELFFCQTAPREHDDELRELLTR